jgi:hypothetical protein
MFPEPSLILVVAANGNKLRGQMLKYTKRLTIFTLVLIFFASLTATQPSMSYEEPRFEIVKKTSLYEIRLYAKRTVAQVTYSKEDNGFRVLFDYISGKNEGAREVQMTVPVTQSKKIDMTAPVTQSNRDGAMLMRFFLPKQYSVLNAPKPTDTRIRIIDLPEEYYAVISYSGFASDSNFLTHNKTLSAALAKDGVVMTGPPIKATYNSPFTLPFLRRNEAMYPVKWP